ASARGYTPSIPLVAGIDGGPRLATESLDADTGTSVPRSVTLLIRPRAASRLFRCAHPYLKVRACFASARGYTSSIPLVTGIDGGPPFASEWLDADTGTSVTLRGTLLPAHQREVSIRLTFGYGA